jgi:hypothetical protein
VPFAARSSGSYFMLACGFAATLLVCGVILASGWGLRPIWIGGFWIALIGMTRYLVAAWREHRSGAAAWA